MKKFVAAIIFWGCILFGPTVFSLLNALTPYRIEPGTLTYLFTMLLLQAASAGVACFLANEYLKEERSSTVRTNATIAATIMGVLAVRSVIGGDILGAISDVIAIATLITQGIRG